jgi:hypothetical protein
MEEQLRINGVVTVAPDPSVHSSLQQMEKSGAVSAMTAQFSVGEVGDSPAPATTTIAAASPADLEEAETWATAATPITQEIIAEPETMQATTTEISASTKSSVNFVFGLIMAASEEPITEGYLKTAHQITKNVLTAAATTYDTSMILSSLSYPKVRSITKDNGAVYACLCVCARNAVLCGPYHAAHDILVSLPTSTSHFCLLLVCLVFLAHDHQQQTSTVKSQIDFRIYPLLGYCMY